MIKSERRARRRPDDEDGLALLDVLIGMAIFALLGVIAVSAVSQYRVKWCSLTRSAYARAS